MSIELFIEANEPPDEGLAAISIVHELFFAQYIAALPGGYGELFGAVIHRTYPFDT